MEKYQVSFRPQGEKLISQGQFTADNGTITLKKKNGVFVKVLEPYLEFTLKDVAAVRPGEMKGYSSLIFDLKSGESVDISLPKKLIAAMPELIRKANG